jgi:hypothetical protein
VVGWVPGTFRCEPSVAFGVVDVLYALQGSVPVVGCRGPSGVAIGGGRHCRDVCFLRQRTCCCVGAGDLQA